MKTIQDATGAVVSLWEAKQLQGMTTEADCEGAACWFELVTTDLSKSNLSYSALLNWTLEFDTAVPLGGATFRCKGLSMGDVRVLHAETGAISSHWRHSVGVNNCAATLDRARSLGALVLTHMQDVRDMGHSAMFTSPDGITCIVVECPDRRGGKQPTPSQLASA